MIFSRRIDLKQYDLETFSDTRHHEDGEQRVRVSQWISHPDYRDNGKTRYNDFAILKLSTSVVFSASVSPACLPASALNTYDSVQAEVTGWGSLSSSGSMSRVLQKVTSFYTCFTDIEYCFIIIQVTVNTMTNAECRNTEYNPEDITDNMLCAAAPGKDYCQVHRVHSISWSRY